MSLIDSSQPTSSKAWLELAFELDAAERYDEALKAAENAYSAAVYADNAADVLYASRRLALLHFNQEALALALKACERARPWTEICSDPGAIAGVHSVHGGVLVELGDVETGLEIIHSAILLTKDTPDKIALWRSQTAYAVAMYDIGDYETAAASGRASLETLLQSDADAFLLLIGHSIAGRTIARAEGERKLRREPPDMQAVREAGRLFNSVLDMARDGNNSYEMSEAHCFLGVLAWVCGNDVQAGEHYSRALLYAGRTRDEILTVEIGYWMAALSEATGDYRQAREYLQGIEPLVWAFEAPRRKVRYYKARSQLEAAAGLWKDAYEFHKLFHEQTVLDFKRLATARAQVMQISLELEHLRAEERRAREERELLIRENENLAIERQALATEALRDPLTGLGNRRELAAYCERIRQSQSHRCAVLLIDLDHFKRINDTFSHAVGDIVLITVARLLQSGLEEHDCPIRLGGEELVVLLPNTDPGRAMAKAETIRLGVSSHDWQLMAHALAVTCSIGLSEWKPASEDFDQALRRADQCLYLAKQQGRNRCVAAPDAGFAGEADAVQADVASLDRE